MGKLEDFYRGRVALVTGASSGIGRATARALAARGARVGLVARNTGALEELEGEIRAAGGEAVAVPADLSTREGCFRAAGEVRRVLGPVDVLFNVAGILRRGFLLDVNEEDLEESWRVDAAAPLWLAQAALPEMLDRGFGRIVNVSSELGLVGGPSYAAYSMAKWALCGLTEVMRMELRGTPVRVTVVCPTNVRTPQFAEERAWGPVAGPAPEKALSPEKVAEVIIGAAVRSPRRVVVDTPWGRFLFWLAAALPGIREPALAQAFRAVLGLRKGGWPRRAAGESS